VPRHWCSSMSAQRAGWGAGLLSCAAAGLGAAATSHHIAG
jgi:hypothetical protein